jgi:integrase
MKWSPWRSIMRNQALARIVMLAVETGQCGSDIVKMRWSDIEGQTDLMPQPT